MINYSIAIMGTKPGTKKENITETKAYGVAQVSEVIDINAFAKHIANHGSVYDKGDIVGLLTIAVGCLRELMLEGKRVKLGDLGDFQPRLRTTGAVTTDDFSVANYGKKYAQLDDDKQKIVRKCIPQQISEAEPKDTKLQK